MEGDEEANSPRDFSNDRAPSSDEKVVSKQWQTSIEKAARSCFGYMKENNYLPIFLLLSLYGLFSAILIIISHQGAEVACSNTFSRGIEEDARLCYPDLSVMMCSGSQVLSLTGECYDGYPGQVVCGGRHGTALDFAHEGTYGDMLSQGCWSEDNLSTTAYHYVIKKDPFNSIDTCDPPEFGSNCACCDGNICETGGRFVVPIDLPVILHNDIRYPHFGPGCTSELIDSTWLTPGISSQAQRVACHAYCSDGNWVDTWEEANTRRIYISLTYAFAWIGIGIEALCFVVALFHGFFPKAEKNLPCKYFPCKPVTERLISYYTLLALGNERALPAKQRERSFQCRDRTVMFLVMIQKLISAVLSGTVVFMFNSSFQMMLHWDYLNFFVVNLLGIVGVSKEVYKANNFERLERVDVAVAADEATVSQEQVSSSSSSSGSRSNKKGLFLVILGVCVIVVGLALALRPGSVPVPTTPPTPPPVDACKFVESTFDPLNEELFAMFDSDLSGGLSSSEYSAYIDCLYDNNDKSLLPPFQFIDSKEDGEITFDEYKLSVAMAFRYKSYEDEDRDQFYSFDVDKSGGLSPKEFQKYYESSEFLAYHLPDDYLDIYFEGDKTVELTHDEFQYNPYTSLTLVDMDRDGELSKHEFIFAFQTLYSDLIGHSVSNKLYDQYFAEGDENEDGKISTEEWYTLNGFVGRDEDGDGKWSANELSGIFCNPGKYLSLFDFDKDGYLSYSEYLTMDHYDWTDKEEAVDIGLQEYNSFDYNEDGFLSRNELKDNMQCWTAASVIITIPKAIVDLYMDVGDRNGDGKIGFVEWAVLKPFYLVDNTSQDGFLTEEEWDWLVSNTDIDWEFDAFDENKDSMVSLEEWMVNAAQAFGLDYNE